MAIVRTAAPVVGLGVLLELPPRWALGLDAAFIPTQTLPLGPGTVDVDLLSVAPTTCVRVLGARRAIRLAACASFAFGLVRARGHGFTHEASATRPWLAAGAGLVGMGPLVGSLGWTARVAAFVPTNEESFAIEGIDGVAYAPPRVGGIGSLGLVWASN